MGMGRDPLTFLLLPWNITFRGQPAFLYRFFDGVLSPLLLLWAFWAVLRGTGLTRRLLLLSLGGVYLWGVGPQQLRFLLPLILLLSALVGAHWRSERGLLGAIQGALFLLTAGGLLAPFLVETARDTLPVVLGREKPERYLNRKVQSYEAFQALPHHVPTGERVFLIWENRVYYGTRPFIADSFFEASEAVRMAERAGSPDRFLAELKDRGCEWVLVNRQLEKVFARYSPPPSVRILNEAVGKGKRVGSWKGIELYRIE
jgi:hypothetical protein